uniref:Uncharacterized protein n=1 Tax=Trichogramma kaykai TaxID=54128 RepID=A0ABD2WFZ6_9HYME
MFGREIEIKIFSRREEKDDSHPIMDKSPKIARRASTRTPNRPIVKDITESETLSDGSPDHCYISWSDKTQKEITKSQSVVPHIPLAKLGDISFLLQRNKLIKGLSLPDFLPSSRQSSSAHDGYLIAGQRFCGLAAASYVCKCTVVVINCVKKVGLHSSLPGRRNDKKISCSKSQVT